MINRGYQDRLFNINDNNINNMTQGMNQGDNNLINRFNTVPISNYNNTMPNNTFNRTNTFPNTIQYRLNNLNQINTQNQINNPNLFGTQNLFNDYNLNHNRETFDIPNENYEQNQFNNTYQYKTPFTYIPKRNNYQNQNSFFPNGYNTYSQGLNYDPNSLQYFPDPYNNAILRRNFNGDSNSIGLNKGNNNNFGRINNNCFIF